MPNRLPVPEELLHLIEKRDVDSAESSERRADVERRQLDLGPVGSAETATSLDQISVEEQRSGKERRGIGNRRTRQ